MFMDDNHKMLKTIYCNRCEFMLQTVSLDMIFKAIRHHSERCGRALAVKVVKVELPKTSLMRQKQLL